MNFLHSIEVIVEGLALQKLAPMVGFSTGMELTLAPHAPSQILVERLSQGTCIKTR
jgi:hypothetical protein